MLGLSERGCKKTSEPGSVLHSAKKSMLLVFSVFAVRAEVRRAVWSPVKGYNAGTRQMLGSLGRASASTQVWLHQPQTTTLVHCTQTNVTFINYHRLLASAHLYLSVLFF